MIYMHSEPRCEARERFAGRNRTRLNALRG